MAQRSNIYIDQGIDFVVDLDVFLDDGNPLDLTNYTLNGSIRKMYSSSKVYNFSINLTSTTNKIEISLPGVDSSNIEPGKYQYDVVVTAPDGTRTKIIEGLVFILSTITGVSQ